MNEINPPIDIRDFRALRSDMATDREEVKRLAGRVDYLEEMMTTLLKDFANERKRVLQSGIKDSVAREDLG